MLFLSQLHHLAFLWRFTRFFTLQDGLSAQATLWSSKSRPFVTLSSSFVRLRKQGMHKGVIKICAAANKEEATTHGPTSSIPPKKLLEPEIQQTTTTTPEMEREIWDMFMRAEANEEKALDASQEDARVQVATTTAVLEPPGKKMGKFEGNKYLFCTEGTGKVSVYYAFFPNLSFLSNMTRIAYYNFHL